ncbi:MAG: hypothetical protein ABH810_02380 [bacterium]
MNEIINYTRLTTSDKLPNKFVTCQAYIPQDKDQSERGMVFSQIEISSAWFPTSQVGQTAINTLIKEYYRATNSSELVNFEESVKKVNESLAFAAQNGETDWIGKLSGVLVLLNGTEIHFAQTGTSHAYLYRGGKINHITEGLETADAPHPLKTFSNLTSGSLLEADRVIIANDAFFEVINPNELKMIITSSPPSLAALECAKIFQNQGTQDANAIFIELTTRDKLANLPPDQKVEAVYLDEQIQTISSLSKNAFRRVFGALGSSLMSSYGKVREFSRHQVKPIAKKGYEISKEKTSVAISKTKEIAKNQGKKFDAKLEKMSEERGHENKSALILVTLAVTTYFTKTKNKIKRFLIRKGIYSENRSRMYLILLSIVIIILVGTVFLTINHRNNVAKTKTAEEAYNQMVSLSGEADVLASKGLDEEALTRYVSAIELQAKAGSGRVTEDAEQIASKIKEKIKQLAHLKDIEPNRNATLDNISAISYLGNNLFATAGGDLYKLGNSDSNKIAAIGSPIDYLVAINELDLFAGLTRNQVVTFDKSGNDFKNQNLDISSPSTIYVFSSNIYIADKPKNTLWKSTYNHGFEEISPYFEDDIKFKEIISLAIDGSVYTLSNNAEVKRYSRGQEVGSFSLKLPGNQRFSKLYGIFSKVNSDFLYVLSEVDHEIRLARFSKTGEFDSQFNLNSASNIEKSTMSESLDEITIVSGNKIASFKIN